MNTDNQPLERLVHDLQERAKELNCLYKVQELLSQPDRSLDEICQGIIAAIPPGWQYPEVCQAKISINDRTYQTDEYADTPWMQTADILVQDDVVGQITVAYQEEKPQRDEGPFLKEERKLIDTIAEQLGYTIFNRRLREVFEQEQPMDQDRKAEWWTILNLLKRTDPKLLIHVSRKMLNYLCWNKVHGAEPLLKEFSPIYHEQAQILDDNRPQPRKAEKDKLVLTEDIFQLASNHLDEETIIEHIHHWIKEDQSNFLVNSIANPSSSLDEISSSIDRYHRLKEQGLELSPSRDKSARVSLTRRLLSDQPEFVHVASQYLAVDDFHELLNTTIFPTGSHGKLGGKSAGLFLAKKILEKSGNEQIGEVKIPKTWFLASDTLFYFIDQNSLEDVVEQKYKDLDQISQEYPYIVHVFKNAAFPPDIIRGLSIALDHFGNVPLIIRSSSLLEDRMGMAFAGKYKSLFISNQGTKEERLGSLMDAIAEVYASMFGPDPIEYRLEHGLIDHHEEMGILIQEVVGTQVGPYYLPTFAGVGFSKNDYPWSKRITRDDGLLRIVPGLGTRAVDRVSNDYPILASPGQPGLRVNISVDEISRYSPKNIDLINLDSGSFETVPAAEMFQNHGADYPHIQNVVSVVEEDHVSTSSTLRVDFKQDSLVVTFERLLSKTPFLAKIRAILGVLEEKLDHPVDIEFACAGNDFYLLQCRSQSYQAENKPAPIPDQVNPDHILFSAHRYITNGEMQPITHIVYVNPEKYRQLESYQDMLEVGQIIGSLNKQLPRRKFILMGPGRWGSRGDQKLGVKVTWSDIRNTAMLIEIARKEGDYLPEPSFGTHFFQDLVEASIRYIPLYPDDPQTIFNESFLENKKNQLQDFLPSRGSFSEVIQVINIPETTGGMVLRVLMNAEEETGLAFLDNRHQDQDEKIGD